MNFIKHGKKRINLEEVAFIVEKETRRMSENSSDEYKDIYSLDFISNGKHMISIDFETKEERERFMAGMDQKIGAEYIKY